MDERIARTIDTYEEVADRYQSLHGDRSAVEPVVSGFRERVAEATGHGPNGSGGDTADASGDRPRVLDVGCGPGWETATFADAGLEALGLDVAPSFLATARQRAPEAAFLRGDMRRLPVATGAVDGVFALASLLHVPESEVDDALAELARVIADGGVLAVVMKLADRANRESPYGDADRRHFEFYEREELVGRVERAGFAAASVTVDDGWIALHASLS